jgi:hypothetical protein
MSQASRAVDAYLGSRFATDLEQVLLDAASGIVSLALARSVEIVCEPQGSEIFDDDGMVDHYAGRLSLEGLTYRFRCSIFSDAGGERYVESLAEFEPVTWGARLVVGAP